VQPAEDRERKASKRHDENEQLESRIGSPFGCIERWALFGEYLSAAGHCVQEKSVGWDPVAAKMPAA